MEESEEGESEYCQSSGEREREEKHGVSKLDKFPVAQEFRKRWITFTPVILIECMCGKSIAGSLF